MYLRNFWKLTVSLPSATVLKILSNLLSPPSKSKAITPRLLKQDLNSNLDNCSSLS